MVPKFRAWDKKLKKMCIVDRLTFQFESTDGVMAEVVEDINAPGSDEFRRTIFPENLILLQSTGLLDKNGTEVFEGDILEERVKTKCCNKTKFYQKLFVEYGYGGWIRKEAGGEIYFGWGDFNNCKSDDIEIIGSIYENPELLEQTDGS